MTVGTATAKSQSRALQQLTAWDGGRPISLERSNLKCPVLMITTGRLIF
jgi:hypothetical protein